MKLLIRNIRFVSRRFRLSTALNVLGLSTAFTIFMVIMMQVYYDRTYNSSIPELDQLYLLNYTVDGNPGSMSWGPEFARLRNASSGIKEASFIMPWTSNLICKIKGHYDEIPVQKVDTSYLKMTGFQMLSGHIGDLTKPDVCFIPESFARKHFGRTDVVGEPLDEPGSVTIGGVYRDFPKNCMVGNVAYIDIDVDSWVNNSSEWSFHSLVKFDNPATGRQIVADLDSFAANSARLYNSWGKKTYQLSPVSELHYGRIGNLMPTVDAKSELLRILSAILILIIAGINFTNFSIALAPVRMKSINTQKVFGATKKNLRLVLIAEAVAISAAAYLLSVAVAFLLSKTSFFSLTDAGIDPVLYYPVTFATFGVALLVGLAAGAYPAFHLTTVSPSVALKGNFGLSRKGVAMRNVMIGVQYFASFVLVVLSISVWKQRQHMIYSDYGFDRDQLITFDVKMGVNTNLEAVMADLEKITGVESTATAAFLIGGGTNIMGWTRTVGDEKMRFDAFPVSPDFLKTVGIEIEDGRGLLPGDSLALVFNREARQQWPEFVKPGNELPFGEVTGICSDSQYLSMYMNRKMPMAFVPMKGRWKMPNFGYVRVASGTDMFRVMDAVRKVLQRYEPEYPINVSFYDTLLERTYWQETRQMRQIGSISLITVLICIVGVFGLVMFDSEYRRREIAVRKVFGSTTNHIIGMFLFKYLQIMCVSFVLSVPLSVYLTDHLLKYFPEKATIGWTVYALALLALSIITVVTVACQCHRAAKANPIESLKYE